MLAPKVIEPFFVFLIQTRSSNIDFQGHPELILNRALIEARIGIPALAFIVTFGTISCIIVHFLRKKNLTEWILRMSL
jgi:hypothetical protein